VWLPVGCHAPYNSPLHLRRDVAFEERGRMRAAMGDRVVLERRQPNEWATGLQSKDPAVRLLNGGRRGCRNLYFQCGV